MCRRGLAAKGVGGAALEQVDGGVLAVDVVAYFGSGHGGAHFLGWARDCIGTEIDDCGHWLFSYLFIFWNCANESAEFPAQSQFGGDIRIVFKIVRKNRKSASRCSSLVSKQME